MLYNSCPLVFSSFKKRRKHSYIFWPIAWPLCLYLSVSNLLFLWLACGLVLIGIIQLDEQGRKTLSEHFEVTFYIHFIVEISIEAPFVATVHIFISLPSNLEDSWRSVVSFVPWLGPRLKKFNLSRSVRLNWEVNDALLVGRQSWHHCANIRLLSGRVSRTWGIFNKVKLDLVLTRSRFSTAY